MSADGWLRTALYLGVLLALAKPLGWYMAQVYEGKLGWLNRFGTPVEKLVYRMCGTNSGEEMDWKRYAVALLLFNLAGALAVYALQRLQGFLPLNPAGLAAVSPDSAFNTAVSFATNTNWQGYGGDRTRATGTGTRQRPGSSPSDRRSGRRPEWRL